jgi:hypothetical protein
VLIAFITVAAFLPTLHNQFVSWDDDQNFLNNPHYRGLGWPQVRWMWTTFHMGLYIPLTWMTIGLDYLLWGMKPFGYHLTSLLLHATNAVVFYLVALRILGVARSGPGERDKLGLAVSAAFAALLFALHPLRVESVAWVTERRDVLSGLFYLLTVLVYLRTCERGERGRGEYWGAVALFACALLSNPWPDPGRAVDPDVSLRRLGDNTGRSSCPCCYAAVSAMHSWRSFRSRRESLTQLSALGRLSVAVYGLIYLEDGLPRILALYELGTEPLDTAARATAWRCPHRAALAAAAECRAAGGPLAYVVIRRCSAFRAGAADRYTYQPPGLGALGWGRPALRMTAPFPDDRTCHLCPPWLGGSHLEPSPRLA